MIGKVLVLGPEGHGKMQAAVRLKSRGVRMAIVGGKDRAMFQNAVKNRLFSAVYWIDAGPDDYVPGLNELTFKQVSEFLKDKPEVALYFSDDTSMTSLLQLQQAGAEEVV